MGMFLSMTSIIGNTRSTVINSLANYSRHAGGGLEEEVLPIDHDNCCVIEEGDGNTTIFNPYAYQEWDKSAAFISKELNAPVFSFHIHDGDFWMYQLYVNGVVVDRFNPIPDYWEEMGEKEMQSWRGSAAVICKYAGSVKQADIKKYLVRWDLDAEESIKAYPDDEYAQEDWQLLDFMKKLGLPYPLNDDGTPKGVTYKLWTEELPLNQQTLNPAKATTKLTEGNNKPWWKFW